MAHQADAPGFALERAEAAADLDAVVVEQALARRCRSSTPAGILTALSIGRWWPSWLSVGDAQLAQAGLEQLVGLRGGGRSASRGLPRARSRAPRAARRAC